MSAGILGRYRGTLVRLFADVHQLYADPANVTLCADIQERLLDRIVYVERRVRSCKARVRESKRDLGTRRAIPLTRDEAQLVKGRVAYYSAAVDDYNDLLFLLRAVGDAVAFTYVDKWDIKPLSFKESPGFISGKVGGRLERQLARDAWKARRVVIVNDLTNCLRHGDLTVPLGRTFGLIEVKAGSASGPRVERQKAGLKKLADYLRTDRAEGIFGLAGTVRRTELGSEERHHRPAINKLIADAFVTGEAWAEVEPGLYYIALTTEGGVAFETILRSRTVRPMVAMVNEAKHLSHGYFPFTLALTDPEAVFRFYAGSLVLWVIVDAGAVHRGFAQRGYSVSLSPADDDWPVTVSKTGAGAEMPVMKVGAHFTRRLFTEFISLDWFIEETLRHPTDGFLSGAVGPDGEPLPLTLET